MGTKSERGYKFVVDFIGIIGGLCSIVGFVVWILSHFKVLNGYWAIPFFLMAALLILIYSVRKQIFQVIMNISAVDTRYTFISRISTYEYHSSTSMEFTENVLVRPRCKGLQHIYNRYYWSGGNDCTEVLPLEPDQKILDIDECEGIRRCQISLSKNGKKNFNKGDDAIRSGMVVRTVRPPSKKIEHFLSCGIWVITKDLTLRVVLPNDMKPKCVRRLEYLHYCDFSHWKAHKQVPSYDIDPATNKVIIEWVIHNPVYGGKYTIDWDFDETC